MSLLQICVFSSSSCQASSLFFRVIDRSRLKPTKLCSFSSMFSKSVWVKSTSGSISWRRVSPAGGRAMPRLFPSVPVENTKVSSTCGIVLFVLCKGMKIRSWVSSGDFGRNMAFPVRFSSRVIARMTSMFPSICASLIFFGMLFSVIRKIMNRPIKMEVNPIFIDSDVAYKSDMMPRAMSGTPMIFAQICGCWN